MVFFAFPLLGLFVFSFPVIPSAALHMLGVEFFIRPGYAFDMAPSALWTSVPVYLLLLALFNRLWLRPYLARAKGVISRDDQLPYVVIPTLILAFLMLLFDLYRYNIGSLPVEQIRFSFLVSFWSMGALIVLWLILPRLYHVRLQGNRCIKQMSPDMVAIHCGAWVFLASASAARGAGAFFDAYLSPALLKAL